MKTQDILGVLGGLALFLYGMQMMSEGLQMTAGNQLESVLKHLTSHKVKAVLVGMIVTCLIQSSSAMTIMLIGFINAKVMDLKRAAWVVMGANIGTTITGQMIALDIGMIAPVLAIVGVVMIVFFIKTCISMCWSNHCWTWHFIYGIRIYGDFFITFTKFTILFSNHDIFISSTFINWCWGSVYSYYSKFFCRFRHLTNIIR